jgi:hypothetical protein
MTISIEQKASNVYYLKSEKIERIEAKTIWGIIAKAFIIGLKNFYNKL